MAKTRLVLMLMMIVGIIGFLLSLQGDNLRRAVINDIQTVSIDGVNNTDVVTLTVDKLGTVETVTDTSKTKTFIGDELLVRVDSSNNVKIINNEMYFLAFSAVSMILMFVFIFSDSKIYNHRIIVK